MGAGAPWRNGSVAWISEWSRQRCDCPPQNNIAFACKQLLHYSGKKEEFAFSTVRSNLELTQAEACFAKQAKLDFRLLPGSGAFNRLSAFKPIPLEQIDLVQGEYRIKLPNAVRSRTSGDFGGPAFDSNTDVQRTNQQ